jgi:hypothetical protein
MGIMTFQHLRLLQGRREDECAKLYAKCVVNVQVNHGNCHFMCPATVAITSCVHLNCAAALEVCFGITLNRDNERAKTRTSALSR